MVGRVWARKPEQERGPQVLKSEWTQGLERAARKPVPKRCPWTQEEQERVRKQGLERCARSRGQERLAAREQACSAPPRLVVRRCRPPCRRCLWFR